MKGANQYNAAEIEAGFISVANISEMTRRCQLAAGLAPDGKCGPRTRAMLDGWSLIAKRSPDPWDGRLRPQRWRSRVHGLIVHTTGRRIVQRALEQNRAPGLLAVEHYQRTTGTHYVIDYDGTIWQVASEHQRAYGIGIDEQRAAEKNARGWQAVAGSVVARTWTDTWGGTRTPLTLLPDHPNACAVQCELPPLPQERRSEALSSGLWYTSAQHEAVARLAIDVAQRNGFSNIPAWWRPNAGGRLLEHGDITPVTRMDAGGVYDLGGRRIPPRFRWAFVYTAIFEWQRAHNSSQAG